jgi:hypothetical protein
MAIRDLLWACPLCGSEGALEPVRGAEVCHRCGTSYRRGRRATIVARPPGRPTLSLSPAEWLDRLPDIGIEERFRQAANRAGIIHSEPALLRTEIGAETVSFRGTYLKLFVRLGPPRAGILKLETDRIGFHPYSEPGAVAASSGSSTTSSAPPQPTSPVSITWAFTDITAIQPSSATLQISARMQPLASLQVPGGSIRFWEELLCAALQAHYTVTGRGEIVEFQPRIVTR